MTALVTAAAAGMAAWLLLPASAASLPGTGAPGAASDLWRVVRRRGAATFLGTGVVAGAVVVLLDGTALALGLVLTAAAAAVTHLARRAGARRGADARAERVLEACEALAGEVRAGQPPARALRHCVEVWTDLEPVAATAELGGDVPAALRRLARSPGASGMAEVAAAWQVSATAGAGLAPALMQVAEGARRHSATRRLVASELASAQATARVVASLPVVVLLAGAGLGGDPWHFLLGTPAGVTCLAGGLSLLLAGLAWIERIAVRAAGP